MLKVEINTHSGKEFQGDCLIVPVFAGRERHRLPLAISKVVRLVMDEGDFKADFMEMTAVHHPNGVKEARWLLMIGMGEEEMASLNKLRKAVGKASRYALKHNWAHLGVFSPSTSTFEHDLVQMAVVEGVLLANYDFCRYKSKAEPKALESLQVFTNGEDTRKCKRRLPLIEAGVEAVHRVRNWVNTPPSEMTPGDFAEQARLLAAEKALKLEILEGPALESEGFRALLAVGGGSAHPPCALKVEYIPKEKAKRHVVLVGKGICFDSGGLSLKSSEHMTTMKGDMAGAAIVLATVAAAAQLELPIQITGLMGLAENMPSGWAYKPGDVIQTRSGKTVEVLNTDAEGRLILADLLHWATEAQGDQIIDLATLTGACVVALGEGVSGIMGTDQRLVDRLFESGHFTGEILWQLPLVEEYKEQLKSQVADLKNIGDGRYGGAILAGLFLREFVGEAPWAHLDLSGSWTNKEKDYRSAGGTGEGPRLLLEFLNT